MAKFIKLILLLSLVVLLIYINFLLRDNYFSKFNLESFLNNNSNYHLKIVSKPKKYFNFKDKFIVEVKLNRPSLIDRFRELFLPYRFLAIANSSKFLKRGNIVSFNSSNILPADINCSVIAQKASSLAAKEISDICIKGINLSLLNKYQARAYKKDKVYYKLKNTKLYFVSDEFSWVDFLQSRVKGFYYSHLESTYNASIVSSLLMGTRVVSPPEDFIKSVRKLGLGHFFAASGFHLLSLTLFLMWVFKLIKLPELWVSVLCLLSIFLYSALAGFSPSIVRAAIMLSAYFLLKLVGRKVLSIRLLLIIAALSLVWDPYIFFDLGFQFSYLSTLAILIWASPIRSKINFLPSFFADILSVTLAVQVLLLPLVIYYFSTPQFWTIFANLIFSPFLSLVVVLAFVGASPLLDPLLNLFKFFIAYVDKLPLIDFSFSISFVSFVLLLMIFNFLAYCLTFQKYRKFVFSLFLSFCFIFLALNLRIVSTHSIKINNEGILLDGNLMNPRDVKSSHLYFVVDGVKFLLINNLKKAYRSLDLLNNIQEVNILLLNKANKSVYLEPLIFKLKPDLILCLSKYCNAKTIKQGGLEASKLASMGENQHLVFSRYGYSLPISAG